MSRAPLRAFGPPFDEGRDATEQPWDVSRVKHLEAARALARGDSVTALSLTAGREDGLGLALHGVALAQVREYEAARTYLLRAAALFERSGERLLRARALAALAEVMAAERAFSESANELERAALELRDLGDFANAAWARLVEARMRLLGGDVDAAERALTDAEEDSKRGGTPLVRSVSSLVRAESAARRLAPTEALAALDRAASLLGGSHPTMAREIERQKRALEEEPVGELSIGRERRTLRAVDLEAALASNTMLVDTIRLRVLFPEARIDMASRRVPFSLLVDLARTHPRECSAEALIERTFEAKRINESHRSRLRVELGRLRELLGDRCAVESTGGAWRIRPAGDLRAGVLEPTRGAGTEALLRALLSDGEAWSAGALAEASRRSVRTVQRALKEMLQAGEIRAFGKARARRYTRTDPAERIASQMLLLGLTDPR